LSKLFVTGGAGFIGSNFILRTMKEKDVHIVNIDKLTYAANLQNLNSLNGDGRYTFQRHDINEAAALRALFLRHRPRAVVHFAAESHVDRSILGPAEFVETNVKGTFTLLEEVRAYWNALPREERDVFRFLHVSTDEVYGSLTPDEPAFTESSAYRPNSPYSASKAAGDHLVRAYHHTYGLPTIITNCSNNYGPYQFPEKLLPLVILKAISGQSIPIYGDGKNVRDWLFVDDHCEALETVLNNGVPGETYNIGGDSEQTNLEIVNMVCDLLDAIRPSRDKHAKLISFVKDRPGHDRRYAIDASKIKHRLGWKPKHSLADGLNKTVLWYLSNQEWVRSVQTGAYKEWIERQYSSQTS
jgi:dTDP-glucose 4,6-dehydratase